MYPTFAFRPLTRTNYRVIDAHTGEEYGTIEELAGGWTRYAQNGHVYGHFWTRTEAAQAVYRARHAHGFEMGAL